MCAAFEEYEEVPETVPLDFTEDEVMWVISRIFGAAVALGAEATSLLCVCVVRVKGGHCNTG